MKLKKRIHSFFARLNFLPESFHRFILEKVSDCKICLDGLLYPFFGLQPFFFKRDGNGKVIKEKQFFPKNEWPGNYDDCGNHEGMWYCENKNCPNCKEKQHKLLYGLYNEIKKV